MAKLPDSQQLMGLTTTSSLVFSSEEEYATEVGFGEYKGGEEKEPSMVRRLLHFFRSCSALWKVAGLMIELLRMLEVGLLVLAVDFWETERRL